MLLGDDARLRGGKAKCFSFVTRVCLTLAFLVHGASIKDSPMSQQHHIARTVVAKGFDAQHPHATLVVQLA